jgi:alkylhydroperoxidase family enzyme
MRLRPIEEPSGLMMRIAFWMTERQFGKVLTPMKVLYPRLPGVLKLSYEIQKFETKGLQLEPSLRLLVASLASQLNGCGFCVDIARAVAVQEHLGMDKFNALSEYRTSPLFSSVERAALAYVEEVTRHKRVSDATFEELRKHFTEREIVEITWLNAVHNYYNLINVPLEIESDGLCAIADARARSSGALSSVSHRADEA